VLGDLTSLLATLKGLPTGYNKDIQDDKRALFGAVDTMQRVLPAVAGALAECVFRTDRMNESLSSTMMATDLADYLVAKGVTFRDAHAAVGRLVREAESQGVELSALPLKTFVQSHAAFGADLFDALSAEASVNRREVEGATGPNAVSNQLEAAVATLAVVVDIPRGNAIHLARD
jgi:argininosuccinate lyase